MNPFTNFPNEQNIAKSLSKSKIQSPFLFRSIERARFLSAFLIDEKGVLIKKELPSFPEGIYGENDWEVICHFKHVLETLYQKKELLLLFNRFLLPVSNAHIKKLVIYSLDLPLNAQITLRDLRRAVLSALLTPLRQNIGSCFATAPAILIQREQIERLLFDLFELMMKSKLSRTIDGQLKSVPISLSFGIGDLNQLVDLSDPTFLESPGLKKAFASIGIKNEEIKKYVSKEGTMTVQNLIERVVFLFFRINPTDLKEGFLRKKSERVKEAYLALEEAKNRFKIVTDHALLRTWEYTLASFSDYKIEFSRWNLFASLGFDSKEEGGIGELIYKKLQDKLDKTHQEIEKLYQDYLKSIDEERVLKALLRGASSYEKVRQLKGQLIAQTHQAQVCEELFENASHKGEHLSHFFPFLVEKYMEQFQYYFQEIYDPEMIDIHPFVYDDAPAGFRLVYKHGRQDPSCWTLIQNQKEYIESLIHFFLGVEPLIASQTDWKEGKKIVEEITTALIHHLSTEDFLISAIERMGKAHQKPQKKEAFKQIQYLEKKPWSYTSGGSMHTLLKCYYSLEKEIFEEVCVVKRPIDLLVFLLDLMQNLPSSISTPFEKNSSHGLLMYSPTHAFTFRPGLSPFKEGWIEKNFSYTWARDKALIPGQVFYEQFEVDEPLQHFLAQRFFEANFPLRAEELNVQFSSQNQSFSLRSFRSYLVDFLSFYFSAQMAIEDQIDGFLRSAFPILKADDLQKLRERLSEKTKKPLKEINRAPLYFLEAYDHFYSLLPPSTHSYDLLDETFLSLNLAPPSLLLFADTNWSNHYFGMGYNPGIGGLDLYRVDLRSRRGYPLSIWRPFIDGRSEKPWGVLSMPSDYNRKKGNDFLFLPLTKRV